MDSKQLKELKLLAQAATPGPWKQFRPKPFFVYNPRSGWNVADCGNTCQKEMAVPTAAYIAAIYPQITMDLINESEKLLAISGLVSERHGDDDHYMSPEDEWNDSPERITIKRIFDILDGRT